MPFFRIHNGALQSAREVFAPDFSLLEAEKDKHEYPVDGWYLFPTEYAARTELNHWEDVDRSTNWQGWQLILLTNPDVIATFEQLPKVLVSALTTLIGQVSDKPDTVQAISAIWGQIAPGIPQQVRDAIKLAAEANNLPADFVAVI